MKKKNLLVLMCLFMAMLCTTTFTSCSDDDDDNSPSGLIGKWKSVSADMDGYKIEYNDQMYMTMDITDKTITSKSFTNGVEETSETETSTYKIEGNKIIDADGDSMEYSLSGNTLNLTWTDEEGTLKIVFKRQ